MYHTQLLLKLSPDNFLMCYTQLLLNSEFWKMPIHLTYRHFFNRIGKEKHRQQQDRGYYGENLICNSSMKNKISSNKKKINHDTSMRWNTVHLLKVIF